MLKPFALWADDSEIYIDIEHIIMVRRRPVQHQHGTDYHLGGIGDGGYRVFEKGVAPCVEVMLTMGLIYYLNATVEDFGNLGILDNAE